MKIQKLVFPVLGCSALAAIIGLAATGSSGYRLQHKYKISGNGTWDYVAVDSTARRVYIAHQTEVNVIDADTGSEIGKVTGLKGSHGVAIAPGAGKGFITDGLADQVVIFDLKTLKTTGSAPTGKKPDSIMYEPVTKRVFAYNGDSDDATVIDSATGKVAGTIALGGAPEFSVADLKGKIYLNLENKSETLRIDAATMKVEKRFPLAPCEEPSAMAIDQSGGKLFIGCANKKLAIFDIASGKVVAALPIGPHVDATAYDPETKMAFASTYDGVVTVVQQNASNQFVVVDSIATKHASKTMDVDLKTHALWVASADFQPKLAAGAIRTPQGTAPVPGSFTVMVYGK